ncbi:hypothetical protein DH2020_030492 [Rehmannia glutinosa]|uniref:F-box domain-containing protein n=1 Tax=Rehmannia glutinosa TaxID=99300 RepID=A0ABR0VKQ2_REHGL
MAGRSRFRVSWSDLPSELLQRIAKRLDTETDVRRFRAVCNSWRSSTTPFKKFPRTPLKLPFPFAAGETSHPKHEGAYFNLIDRTVYRVQLPDSKEPDFWLVKVESSRDGKLRLLNPLSDRQIEIQPEIQMPKVLNTLDYRVSEVCQAYVLQYVNPSKPKQNDEYKYAKKVVVSTGVKNDEYVVMAIDDGNKLSYIKSGDQKWTMVPDNGWRNKFVDVVYVKGQFYGIDLWGGTWVFDSMFERTKITYNIYQGASKRHLLELYNNGELYLVEEVTDKDKIVCRCDDIEIGCQCNFSRTRFKNTAVEIKISRIDKRKEEWVEAKTVKDRIIFVGDDCSFSVSAKEFEGCNGTRVFYTDQYIFFRTEEEKKPHYHDNYDYDYDDNCDYDYNYFECDCCNSSDYDSGRVDNFVPSDDVKLKFRGLHGHNTGVCDFESGKIGSLLMFHEYADIFWPPPSWLR